MSSITTQRLIIIFLLIYMCGQLLYLLFNCHEMKCLESNHHENTIVIRTVIVPKTVTEVPKKKLKKKRTSLNKQLIKFFKHKSNDSNFKYIIRNDNFCKNQTVLVINFVLSAPDQINDRNLIRNLWGNYTWRKPTGFYTVHIVGIRNGSTSDLAFESESHKDIIQVDINDNYDNLSQKVYAGLDWVNNYCPKAQWIMKSDTDVFVNIFKLTKYLERLDQKEHGMRFICRQKSKRILSPCRNNCKKEEWLVKKNEYPFRKYPPHCHGPAYIMSRKLSSMVCKKSRDLKPFRMEDVYYTGIIPLFFKTPVKFNDLSSYFPWRPDSWQNSFAEKDLMILELNGKLGEGTSHKLWNMIIKTNT